MTDTEEKNKPWRTIGVITAAFVLAGLITLSMVDDAGNLNDKQHSVLDLMRWSRIVIVSLAGIFFWNPICQFISNRTSIEVEHLVKRKWRVLFWYWVLETIFILSTL